MRSIYRLLCAGRVRLSSGPSSVQVLVPFKLSQTFRGSILDQAGLLPEPFWTHYDHQLCLGKIKHLLGYILDLVRESIRTGRLSTGLITVGHYWIWFFNGPCQAGHAGFPWICFGSWGSAARFSSSHESVEDRLAYIGDNVEGKVLGHEEFWVMKSSGAWRVLGHEEFWGSWRVLEHEEFWVMKSSGGHEEFWSMKSSGSWGAAGCFVPVVPVTCGPSSEEPEWTSTPEQISPPTCIRRASAGPAGGGPGSTAITRRQRHVFIEVLQVSGSSRWSGLIIF